MAAVAEEVVKRGAKIPTQEQAEAVWAFLRETPSRKAAILAFPDIPRDYIGKLVSAGGFGKSRDDVIERDRAILKDRWGLRLPRARRRS